MKKKDLLKQLHNLKNEIKPDLIWQKANREILLSQIKAQTNSDFAFSHKLFAKNLFMAIYKPVGSLILIFGILFGTWVATVGATKNSLPGGFWYGFKLTTERMQVNLTLNDEKRTNLEMAFAERRLEEIKKTIAKKDSSSEKKNLEVTFKKYQESINNVKSNLAKLEVSNKQTALKVADLVDSKTKAYVDILKTQQIDNPQLKTVDTEDAISVSKATGDKALSVILEEFETGSSNLKIDDLRQKINERIDNLAQSIEAAKSNISQIIANKKIADEEAAAQALVDKKAAEEAAAKAQEEANLETEIENTVNENVNTNINADSSADNQPSAENNINSPENSIQNEQPVAQVDEIEEVLPTIEEIKDKPKEAEVLLAKAKDYLKSGSVSQAFDLVKQADDTMTLVEKVIQANKQYLDTQIQTDATSSFDDTADKQEEVNG